MFNGKRCCKGRASVRKFILDIALDSLLWGLWVLLILNLLICKSLKRCTHISQTNCSCDIDIPTNKTNLDQVCSSLSRLALGEKQNVAFKDSHPANDLNDLLRDMDMV